MKFRILNNNYYFSTITIEEDSKIEDEQPLVEIIKIINKHQRANPLDGTYNRRLKWMEDISGDIRASTLLKGRLWVRCLKPGRTEQIEIEDIQKLFDFEESYRESDSSAANFYLSMLIATNKKLHQIERGDFLDFLFPKEKEIGSDATVADDKAAHVAEKKQDDAVQKYSFTIFGSGADSQNEDPSLDSETAYRKLSN